MSINICTANVNNENEPRCNQTESTSFTRSHGRILNMGKLHPKFGVIVNKVQFKKVR